MKMMHIFQNRMATLAYRTNRKNMRPFLQTTAQDLYTRFGTDLSDVAVVFPNNRARLFFSEFLYQIAGKPIWSPVYLTIGDLFSQQSELVQTDELELIQRLYDVHNKLSGKEESFDDFYLWGEILLNDFDDVDKNLVDAGRLFRNIQDLANYTDTLEHLSEEQVQSIRLFFKNFNPDRKTDLKNRFLENWNILSQVYSEFKQNLFNNGLAYEGMLHRDVAEKTKENGAAGFDHQSYAFVGFNVLNECEKSLFKALHKAGKALFYWDYDVSYLDHPRHEAGRFMRENLEQFPNTLSKTEFDVFRKEPKEICFLAASTENAGARYLPEWIRHLIESANFKPEETAVVLCNEGLLLPILHSIPEEVTELNVTMGFPLQQTPICTLVNQVAALHAEGFLPGKTPRFNHRFVLPVLQHPLVRMADENTDVLEQKLRKLNSFRPSVEELSAGPLLNILFNPAEKPAKLAGRLLEIYEYLGKQVNLSEESDAYDPLHAEALFRCHTLTSRLSDLLKKSLNQLSMPTFRKLLQQVISKASIPFSGEPVRGMQIMGLLETRNLDFKNVLMLSVNEGMLPKGATDTSFIPYNLRKAFGLTTMEHKDSIFAYYFFRLLQRAEHISLVYNTATEGLNRGEMSRFMLQLKMESGLRIQHFNLTSGIELASARSLRIEKDKNIQEFLHKTYNRQQNKDALSLSPTALNCLMDCSLKFYFQYIAYLKKPDEITEDIDGAMLGNFFHHSAEYIYTTILLRKARKAHDQKTILQAVHDHVVNTMLKAEHLRGIIEASDIEPWLKGVHSLEAVVDLFFRMDFFKLSAEDPAPIYNGEQLVRRNLVVQFLKTLLKRDLDRVPFELIGMEQNVSGLIDVETGITTCVAGNIDRLDKKDGILRILDYKTGGSQKVPKEMNALFQPASERANHIFQVMTYAEIIEQTQPDLPIQPELLYINRAGNPEYKPEIGFGSAKNPTLLTDFRTVVTDFRDGLKTVLKGLFDPIISFEQTPHTEKCAYCDYKNLCRRMDTKNKH
jgi:hypothetical protein